MSTTGRDRTLALNCPRCGVAVAFEIWRADVTIQVRDNLSGQRPLMAGLVAEVELAAKHAC